MGCGFRLVVITGFDLFLLLSNLPAKSAELLVIFVTIASQIAYKWEATRNFAKIFVNRAVNWKKFRSYGRTSFLPQR